VAAEPRWCRSLASWTEHVDGWLRRSQPQDITDLSVLLDARLVFGNAELAAAVRRDVLTALPGEPPALDQLVRYALVFKPPMRLPGNIYLGGGAERGEIDLKDALQSLVAFVRVYAARHRIGRTHTLARVDELATIGVIDAPTRAGVRDAYDTLMRLRLETQAADVRTGRPPISSIELTSLGRTRQEQMRQAFVEIADLQKRDDVEFPEAFV